MKKTKNVIIVLIFSIIMQFTLIEGVFAENIQVVVNNCPIAFDTAPVIISDRTMVPMRKIFESLGATVSYDDATQTITSSNGNTTIVMTIGNNTMWVNNNAVTLDVAPTLINDRTLIPVRAIAESYDCTVDWDEYSQTVKINSNSKFDALKTYIISNGTWDSENNEYGIYDSYKYKDIYIFFSYHYELDENRITLITNKFDDNYSSGLVLELNINQPPISMLVNDNIKKSTLFGYYDETTHQFVEMESAYQEHSYEIKEILLDINMISLNSINDEILIRTNNTISLTDFGIAIYEVD